MRDVKQFAAVSAVSVSRPANGGVAVLLCGLIVLACGTTSLPMQLSVAGVSALAIFTILVPAPLLGTALSWHRVAVSRHALLATPLLLLLVLLAGSSLVWAPRTVAGLQSLTVLICFCAAILAGVRISVAGPRSSVGLLWWFQAAGWLSAVLFGASVLIDGLEAESIMGPRPFAMFALLVMAWNMARVRYLDRRGWPQAALLLLLIILSVSRMAIAEAMGLILLSVTSFRLRDLPKVLVGGLLVVGLALSLYQFPPIRSQFGNGDVREIGGVEVNMAGRNLMWTLAFASAVEAPLTGKGLGSSQALMDRAHQRAGHVHNEYLRFFHDHGVPGLALLILGLTVLAGWSIRGLRKAVTSEEKAVHFAALLVHLVLAGQMLTANPLQYVFFVVPAGLMFGMSLGLTTPPRSGV